MPALHGKPRAPTGTGESCLPPPVLAFGPGPQSSQHGHPAFGASNFRLLAQRVLPPYPLQVPPGWSLRNAEDPHLPAPPAPDGVRGQRGAGKDRPPCVHRGRGRGRGERAGVGGARCSPAKAPTAFLMSSTLSKSVIDILQLFERAEQVRKD